MGYRTLRQMAHNAYYDFFANYPKKGKKAPLLALVGLKLANYDGSLKKAIRNGEKEVAILKVLRKIKRQENE